MHKLYDMRRAAGFETICQLAKRTGLSESTIRGIEHGTSQFKTHHLVAELLAEALSCTVFDIFDKAELSHLGRHPLTGRPVSTATRRVTITVETSTPNGSSTLTITHERTGNICPTHHVMMTPMGVCDDCE